MSTISAPALLYECEGKVAFSRRSQAQHAKRFSEEHQGGASYHVYRCRMCSALHVGQSDVLHKPSRKRRRQAKGARGG